LRALARLRRIVETFCERSPAGEEFWGYSTILPRHPLFARACNIFLKFFYNSSTFLPRRARPLNLSTILLQFFPCLEEFGTSGLAWGTIVEGIIVEELWKHLVNPVPAGLTFGSRLGSGLFFAQMSVFGRDRGIETSRRLQSVKKS
jgi:hypothetical protein